MRGYSSPTLDRVARAVPEARLEHGLSQRELARLSGVSRWAIGRVEHGRPIDSADLVCLAAVLLVLDAHRPPSLSRPPFDEEIFLPLRRDEGVAA